MLEETKETGANVLALLKADLYRHAGEISGRALLSNLLLNRAFIYCFWLRLRRSQFRSVRAVAAVMHKVVSNRYGIQISPLTEIGGGLYLGHHMGVVVNPTAVIGRNCNLSQFVTIGSSRGKAAILGDNVFVGPGVCIVEDVKIGDNVTIGAGAVVIRDVPPNCTVAGNPARVVSERDPARFIKNRWEGR